MAPELPFSFARLHHFPAFSLTEVSLTGKVLDGIANIRQIVPPTSSVDDKVEPIKAYLRTLNTTAQYARGGDPLSFGVLWKDHAESADRTHR